MKVDAMTFESPQSFSALLREHDTAVYDLIAVLNNPESTGDEQRAAVDRVNELKRKRMEAREG
jgi:hypothetical protein